MELQLPTTVTGSDAPAPPNTVQPNDSTRARPVMLPTSRRPRRSGKRRGASATEFAIVAPIFFLMIVGFIEFGRALMVQQVLVNASRVGARQAITTAATTASVESAVEEYAEGVAVPGVDVSVTPNPSTAAPGTLITVTASVPYSEVSWMASPWFLGSTTLTSSSKMRKEGFE
jgi:Flp pilus assembly protein TadG